VLKLDYAHAMVRNPYCRGLLERDASTRPYADRRVPPRALRRQALRGFPAALREGLKAWDPNGLGRGVPHAGATMSLTSKYADG